MTLQMHSQKRWVIAMIAVTLAACGGGGGGSGGGGNGSGGGGAPPGTSGGTWARLSSQAPEGVRFCLLLTDASVLCQAIANWYRLTPSLTGSYVAGTWSLYTSFPPSYVPDAYASAVLADGRVAIVGGEYLFENGGWTFALSNMGAVFDPVTKAWQMLPPPPPLGVPNHWQCIGDAPAAVLSDGRLVVGSKLYQDVAVLDPATLAWSTLGASGKLDALNSEEGWTLLPDGSVLTLDVSSAPLTERLVIAPGGPVGAWLPAGATPADLHTSSTLGPLSATGCPLYHPPGEMGPALLMPDGNVFALGADGQTAIYSPAANTWVAGPTVPNGLNIQDGAAVLLPSGHVLFGASPGATGQGLQYFEFDGVQLQAAAAPLGAAADTSDSVTLLLLPTGQALLVDGSTTAQIYTPSGSSTNEAAWAPAIALAPASLSAGATYPITGTQFNGLSQGSAYGDEYENATNYPLVRITNKATGHVLYARTHDHSTMGVATGSTVVSTHFDVPATIETGASTLQVVANGIASSGLDVEVAAGPL
jgi:hypothetical protein